MRGASARCTRLLWWGGRKVAQPLGGEGPHLQREGGRERKREGERERERKRGREKKKGRERDGETEREREREKERGGQREKERGRESARTCERKREMAQPVVRTFDPRVCGGHLFQRGRLRESERETESDIYRERMSESERARYSEHARGEGINRLCAQLMRVRLSIADISGSPACEESECVCICVRES